MREVFFWSLLLQLNNSCRFYLICYRNQHARLPLLLKKEKSKIYPLANSLMFSGTDDVAL